MFFRPIGKTRWPPWPLIGWDIFDFSSETAERNSTKLNRKQHLNVLYKVCVFPADRKNKMAALASDWLRHLRLLLWNRWTEFNENLTGSKNLNVLYKVCVFRADRKNKMAALASDWLRHFLLLLWNRWTDFNQTWQEARSQCPLPGFYFSGRSEKQDGLPGLWLVETFSDFSSENRWNGIWWNLTGSKISTSSTKFCVFSSQSEKQDGRPCQSIKKVAHCTQVHDMWPFGPLVVHLYFNIDYNHWTIRDGMDTPLIKLNIEHNLYAYICIFYNYFAKEGGGITVSRTHLIVMNSC